MKKTPFRAFRSGLLILVGSIGLAVPPAQADPLYWDTNGAAQYPAGSAPTGTWDSATANWSTSAAGNIATTTYVPGSAVVFSAGSGATGTFTVTLGSNQTATGLNFEEGHVTIAPLDPPVTGATGSDASQILTLTGAAPEINVQNMDATISARINATTAGFTKTGVGRLTMNFGASTINSFFAAGTQTMTINGGTLQLAGTVGTAGNNQFSNTPFNLVINSGGAFVWGNIANSISDSGVFTINAGGTLYVTTTDQIRAIAGSGAIVNTGGLNLALNGTQTYSGIMNGTGGVGVNSSGGTLTLTSANTFSGSTTFNASGAGTLGLLLGHSRAVQNSNLSVNTTTTAGTLVRFGVVPGKTFIAGGLSAASNQTSLNNLLLQDTGGSAITLQVGNNDFTTSFAGVLTGSGGLTKIGTGTLTLAGHYNTTSTVFTANSYTGDTMVNAGTHNASSGGPVNRDTAGTLKLDFNGNSPGLAPANIVNPASRLVLGGGRLQITGKAATVAASTTASQTFNGTLLNVGRSYVTVTSGAANGANTSSVVVNLGAISRTAGGVAEFTLPTGTQSATQGITTTTANTYGILGAWAVIGSDWAMNSGGNIVAYDKVANYTLFAGGTLVSDGTKNIEITGSSTGNIATNAGVTTDVNTLLITDAAARTIDIAAANKLRVGAAGGIWHQGAGTLTIGTATNVGVLTAGGGAGVPGELIINVSGGEVIVNSAITDNGVGNAVTLVKTGSANQLTLSGTNTYTGGTVVTQGRMRVQTNTSLGSGTVIVLPGGQAWLSAGSVFSNNFVVSGTGWGEGTSGVGPGAIRLSDGATLGKLDGTSTLTLAGDARIGGNTTTATIAAKITGDYAIDFASGGSAGGSPSTFTLTNTSNDFSGNLTLNSAPGGGTSIIAYSAFNASPVTVKLGASGVIPNGADKSNVILTGGATGSVVTLDLNGFDETINSLISQGIHANTFVTNSQPGTTAVLTFGDNNSSTLIASNASSSTYFGGSIRNTGAGVLALTKIGEGTQTLTGANTYSGVTTISKGILQAGAANTLSANSAVTLANDATAMLALTDSLADYSQTIRSLAGGGTVNLGTIAAVDATTLTTGDAIDTVYSGTIVGAGGLAKQGSGTFTLTGVNTYLGSTAVNAGTMLVNGSLTGTLAVNVTAGTFGGNGTISAPASVAAGASLQGGDGVTASGGLTFDGNVSLLDGSVIKLTLGAANTHSSLFRTGGIWTFDSDQAFSFGSAQAGTFDNIISGLAGTETDLITGSSTAWDFSDANWSYTFSYDNAGGVDLAVAAVPEPGTLLSLTGGLALLLGWRRRTS